MRYHDINSDVVGGSESVFDELLRELKRLEGGVQVPIQVHLDDDGQIDRRCPSDACQAEFKVVFEDWKAKVRDDGVYCPLCRHEAKATEWNTPAQRDYIRQAGLAHVQKVVQSAMREDSSRFNARQPRGGFICLSLSYRPGAPIIALPPNAAECLRQHFVCEACGCRYSSVGAAFFCPACGHNSAATTFANAVEAVRTSVGTLDAIKDAIRAADGHDAAADTARQILEGGLVRLVASFQRFAEATFQRAPGAASVRVRANLFQNLAESSALWRSTIGTGYDDLLGAAEYAELNVYFQQRHKLSHCEGLVDQGYIDKAQDRTYKVGQKLIIRETAVFRLAELVERLANGLKAIVPPPAAHPS
jgi:hypothetical protein